MTVENYLRPLKAEITYEEFGKSEFFDKILPKNLTKLEELLKASDQKLEELYNKFTEEYESYIMINEISAELTRMFKEAKTEEKTGENVYEFNRLEGKLSLEKSVIACQLTNLEEKILSRAISNKFELAKQIHDRTNIKDGTKERAVKFINAVVEDINEYIEGNKINIDDVKHIYKMKEKNFSVISAIENVITNRILEPFAPEVMLYDKRSINLLRGSAKLIVKDSKEDKMNLENPQLIDLEQRLAGYRQKVCELERKVAKAVKKTTINISNPYAVLLDGSAEVIKDDWERGEFYFGKFGDKLNKINKSGTLPIIRSI